MGWTTIIALQPLELVQRRLLRVDICVFIPVSESCLYKRWDSNGSTQNGKKRVGVFCRISVRVYFSGTIFFGEHFCPQKAVQAADRIPVGTAIGCTRWKKKKYANPRCWCSTESLKICQSTSSDTSTYCPSIPHIKFALLDWLLSRYVSTTSCTFLNSAKSAFK